MSKYVRKKHPKNCIICDEVFYASNRGKNTRKYCSQECRYSVNRLELDCETCGNLVIRTKGNVKNKVYCSKECSNAGKIGVSINTVEKIRLTCLNCSKGFKVLPHAKDKKFCKRKCADEYKKISVPKMSLRSLWETQRVKALERDSYKCQVCYMNNEEHIKKYSRGLNVHHKIPHHYFKEYNEEQHCLSNLKTVCTGCHHVIHNTDLNPMEYDIEKFRSI